MLSFIAFVISACQPSFQGGEEVGVTPIAAAVAPLTSASPIDDGTTRLLELMNKERVKKRRPLLSIDSRLVRAAEDHSESMMRHQQFDHRVKGEPDFRSRLLYRSYPLSHCAENIAMAPDPDQVFQLWFHSKGHKKNIMNPKYTRVGIARSGNYWTADFAAPDGM